MNSLRSISTSLAARAALVSGTAFAAGGITQLVDSQRDAGTDVAGTAGYLVLGFFVVALVALSPVIVAVAGAAESRAANRAGAVAGAGTLVLGLFCITSIANGRDLEAFNVIAPVTNAMWLFGSIVVAVALKRSGRASGLTVAALPLVWLATIPLGTLGGGLISGAVVLALFARPALAPQPA